LFNRKVDLASEEILKEEQEEANQQPLSLFYCSWQFFIQISGSLGSCKETLFQQCDTIPTMSALSGETFHDSQSVGFSTESSWKTAGLDHLSPLLFNPSTTGLLSTLLDKAIQLNHQ
jgi:hypothetical protein